MTPRTVGRSKASSDNHKPARRWITARKIAQYAALSIFVILFILTTHPGISPGLVNLPMRLDPLLFLAHLLSSHKYLSGSALAIILVALSVVFGQAWCGWICPLGTVLDWFGFKRGRERPALDASNDQNWRKVKYSLLIAILIAAFLGNLSLLIFDPLTILFRTLSSGLWPALDQAVIAIESFLINIPALVEPVVAFDAWIRPRLLPVEPAYTPAVSLFTLVFVGIILLNLLAPRFWCRYLCPLGGLLGLISKASLYRRQVSQDCTGCSLCERVCPMGTINPERNFESDPSECTLCLDCLDACPRSSIDFVPKARLAVWREYDPNRRQALTTFGLTIAGLAVLGADARAKYPNPHLIRPPGVSADEFLAHCIRCSECIRACPTHALQPALLEGGLEGLWSPALIPRLGYCDYACNACGQVCPVQAIPPLDLDEKRNQVIGKAYIDQNHCIAWADQTDCIVCEEMCPLPQKAITLELGRFQRSTGEIVDMQLPHVDRQLCIGCGICEYKCPVTGEAAIRVYLAS